jgi:hypothetical protein
MLIEPAEFGLSLLDANFGFSESLDIQEQYDLLIDAVRHALEGDSGSATAKHPEIHASLTGSCLSPLFS